MDANENFDKINSECQHFPSTQTLPAPCVRFFPQQSCFCMCGGTNKGLRGDFIHMVCQCYRKLGYQPALFSLLQMQGEDVLRLMSCLFHLSRQNSHSSGWHSGRMHTHSQAVIESLAVLHFDRQGQGEKLCCCSRFSPKKAFDLFLRVH